MSILLINPQNGEIYACVNAPEFDLNDPFTLNTDADTGTLSQEELLELQNQMWRNACINDTYEPGSTFKIITMSAGLEEGVVAPEDTFYCPGYKLWRTGGSAAIKGPATGPRLLSRGPRIPATLCSSRWACGWEWTIIINIFSSLA